MKRLFVTGGAGFIGSAFVRLALSELPGITVTNFDALTYAGSLKNVEGLDTARHRFIQGDVTDRRAVAAALDQGADAVIHFAAESHVDRSIASADAFLRTNVLGTQVLLDIARERKVGRFLHVSTDEVMGSLPDDDGAFFTEASPFAPNSPYAASKAAAEHLVRAALHTFGLDIVVARCGNNYGPRQVPEKFIPLAAANALQNQSIPVYGDGRNVRDWIFVEDHCRALLWLLSRGASGQTYNIGARNPRRNIDVVRDILDYLGKPMSLLRFVEDRLGHDRRYAIDPAKIEALGWKPRETWQSGLTKTLTWYRENSDWVEQSSARLRS